MYTSTKLLLLVALIACFTQSIWGSQRFFRMKSPHSYLSNSYNERMKRMGLSSSSSDSGDDTPIPYQTVYFNQTIDHFNFGNPGTFPQRYLIADQYWSKPTGNQCNGPLLVYTGGESDITIFYDNSLFITNVLSKELGALVVFAEHRYYGESLPFGSNSFDLDKVGYLSSEQALADYAVLIPSIQNEYGASHCPVITVGGSYSGDLAAWARMKYPDIFDAAFASSGPILTYLTTGYPSESCAQLTTMDYTTTSEDGSCSERIRSAFNEIQAISSQSNGLDTVSKLMNLCDPLQDQDDLNNLYNWIQSVLIYIAMSDYPYPTSFLEPMPGNPVNLSCSVIAGIENDIQALVSGPISIYFNSSGQAGTCFNTSVYSAIDFGKAWDYQACTQMVFPVSSNGVQDMFMPAPFDLESLNEYCQSTWGVTPDPYWIPTYYGNSQNVHSSNIIFSNGILDPWHGGGITTSTDSIIPILIQGGAHHLDLRGPNPLDPPTVTAARQLETKLLTQWTAEASYAKRLNK